MSSTDRLVFAPPRERPAPRAMLLALLAHGLLMVALTWGVHWKRSEPPPALAAELWAAGPQPVAETAAPVTAKNDKSAEQPDADIALKPAKKRPPVVRPQRAAEVAPPKPKPLPRPIEKTPPPPAKTVPPKIQPRSDKQLAEAALQKQREDNLRRMLGQAGGATTGAAAAGGKGQASKSYEGVLTAAIKRNVVWTEDTEGNPTAEIEVRITADGNIIPPPRLVQPSGNPAWDAAALKAITRTGRLPPDIDGAWPSNSFLIKMRPKN